MASSKEFFRIHILEQLSEVEEITYRAMMGSTLFTTKANCRRNMP